MENREAIEWLKGSVVSYEVDNKGRPNGNVTCDLTQEVIDLAISALEKQEQTKEAIPHRNYQYLLDYWCECGWQRPSSRYDKISYREKLSEDGAHGGHRMNINKLLLTILLGLVCPFALLVVPEMEEEE